MGIYRHQPIKMGIRLFFCDLKFNSASGDRNITSNLVGILRKLISPKNGPYILLLWSAHEKEYIDSVREALALEAIYPEFVLPLNKSDYFQADDSYDRSMKNIDDLFDKVQDFSFVTAMYKANYCNGETVPRAGLIYLNK